MLFLILGSAGSGKTALCTLMEEKFEGLKIYTTRPRRMDDKNNYIFVSKNRFFSLYEKGKIMTKSKILNNYYGLENRSFNDDKVVVAVGDWFTINQLRRKGIKYIAIYLQVSLEICKNRMMARGDELRSINKKIALEHKMAKKERSLCSYIINNNASIEKTYGATLDLIDFLFEQPSR